MEWSLIGQLGALTRTETPFHFGGGGGGLAVRALGYRLEGRGFEPQHCQAGL